MKGCSNELREVLGSLTSKPKFIAPKYFYDERGSRLFEVITRLPEYYLTRTEMAILDRCLPDIRDAIGQGVCLVEYGAGSSLKVRRLLETLRPDTYLPVDISHRHLERTAAELHADYPWLKVYPTCADLGEFQGLAAASGFACRCSKAGTPMPMAIIWDAKLSRLVTMVGRLVYAATCLLNGIS